MTKITIDPTCCKGCDICQTICVKKIFGKGNKRNSYGTTVPKISNEESCIDCRICERMCPDGAIEVEHTKK